MVETHIRESFEDSLHMGWGHSQTLWRLSQLQLRQVRYFSLVRKFITSSNHPITEIHPILWENWWNCRCISLLSLFFFSAVGKTQEILPRLHLWRLASSCKVTSRGQETDGPGVIHIVCIYIFIHIVEFTKNLPKNTSPQASHHFTSRKILWSLYLCLWGGSEPWQPTLSH